MTAVRQGIAGFTIIEVMLVLTVIGILVAIAIPVYQDYSVRTRVTEAVGFMAPAKNAVTLYYSMNGSLPSNNEAADMDEPASMRSAVVESVEILAGGVIQVTLRHPAISGHTITLTPAIDGALTRSCSSSLPDQLLPRNCRTDP